MFSVVVQPKFITRLLHIYTRLVGCTRWAELTEGLKFHVNLAKAARAPCEFRLLNSASPILIGTGDADEDARYSRIMNALHQSPSGGTPLVKHIKEIVLEIRSVAEQLSVKGQKVVLIIASDGQSSDGDVVQAMRPLKDLPVSVVVRLCTDEESVVSYWNDIDRDLELELDVLDDLVGEAEEVHRFSPWITYGEPLHRMREFGCANREVDLLDEDVLSMDQLMQFVVLM